MEWNWLDECKNWFSKLTSNSCVAYLDENEETMVYTRSLALTVYPRHYYNENITKVTLIPFFFRAPLIFAQQRRAKINGARKGPTFAQLGARKLIVCVLLKF